MSDAKAKLASHRHEFLFDGSLEQRVLDLQPDERRPTSEVCGDIRLRDFPRGSVGDADVAHLTGTHEILERGQRLFDRRVPVPIVEPVQVDVVRLQAA